MLGAQVAFADAVSGRDLIFVSYSQADRQWLGKFLKFLQPYFPADRLIVWSDVAMHPGCKWRGAIDDALARTRLAVLLVSPDFLVSAFIQEKELPAFLEAEKRDECALLPILLTACPYKRSVVGHYQFLHDVKLPLDMMPKPQRHAELVKICDKIDAKAKSVWGADFHSIGAAAQPAATVIPLTAGHQLGRLHGVPAQRPHFLARDELATLRETLLTAPSAAVGVTAVGLYGMGGIGKTELAVALCHEEAIRRAFPSGIFWLSLGQEPDILRNLADLAGMAGQSSSFASVPLAQEALRSHFAEKTCLLVIDDLWRFGDARDLAVAGPRSRTLITTRDASLLTALAATEVALEVLSPPVALHLLSLWSGHTEPLPPEAADAAEECGRLPLALAVAGARIHDGASWEDVLEALRRGDLEFLDHPYGSVFKSLRMSIAALPADVADRYGELAVFPEDNTPIPITTIGRLWAHSGRLSPRRSRALLADLARKGLLSLVQVGGQEMIRFHDLQQDFLKLDADDLPALHARLLDAHRPAAGSWADLPSNEPYLWTWLCHHLGEAGRQKELKALLLDPAWIAAKLDATGIAATVADYDNLRADEDIGLVRCALTLSAHVLRRDHSQLPGQLVGRLRGFVSSSVTSLCAALEQSGTRHLTPLSASLIPPGSPLLRTLEGHKEVVMAVAVLPDGRRALSGSYDDTLKLWDLESGAVLRTLEGHQGPVVAVAVLPDGRRALSGSYDTTLKLWDLERGTVLGTLQGHFDKVNAVAVLPDGRRALSGSYDGTLKLWDLESGAVLRTLEGHQMAVNAVAVLPDGRRALSGSYDGTLKLWDLESGAVLRTLEGHQRAVNAVAVLPDGRRALSGSEDTTLKLWHLESGAVLRTLQSRVSSVAVLPDGRRALSGSYDTLMLWDLESGAVLRALEGHQRPVNAVAVLPNDRRALSGSDDTTLKLWDLESATLLRTPEGHQGFVSSVAVLPDGRRALSGSYDDTLKLWDLESGAVLRTLEGHRGPVVAVAVLPDGRRALSGSFDNTLKLWDLESGAVLRTLQSRVSAVVVLPDGRRALSGSDDNTLRLWDLESGVLLRAVEEEGEVHAVVVLPDGRRALFVQDDEPLKLWDLESGVVLLSAVEERGEISAMAVLPDGRRALSGSYDGTLKLWDLESGAVLRTLEGHQAMITAVAMLPDGCRALSASFDNTLKLWHVESGCCLATFTSDAAICCVTAADDHLFVAGTANGVLHILRLLT